MSALQAEVYEAFRILDVSDDKALKAAVALSAALTKVEDETAKSFNKRDANVEAIRRDVSTINKEIAAVNTRIPIIQGETNDRMTALESGLTIRMTTLESTLSNLITTLESALNNRITALEGNLNGRIAAMQGEINLLKWMMATTIALLLTVLFRVFTH